MAIISSVSISPREQAAAVDAEIERSDLDIKVQQIFESCKTAQQAVEMVEGLAQRCGSFSITVMDIEKEKIYKLFELLVEQGDCASVRKLLEYGNVSYPCFSKVLDCYIENRDIENAIDILHLGFVSNERRLIGMIFEFLEEGGDIDFIMAQKSKLFKNSSIRDKLLPILTHFSIEQKKYHITSLCLQEALEGVHMKTDYRVINLCREIVPSVPMGEDVFGEAADLLKGSGNLNALTDTIRRCIDTSQTAKVLALIPLIKSPSYDIVSTQARQDAMYLRLIDKLLESDRLIDAFALFVNLTEGPERATAQAKIEAWMVRDAASIRATQDEDDEELLDPMHPVNQGISRRQVSCLLPQ